MNRNSLIVIIAAVLVVSGFVSLQIITSGPESALPVIIQTLNPEGSTLEATAQQAVIFLIYAVIATGSLVVIGGILAQVLRFLDKEITQAQQTDN